MTRMLRNIGPKASLLPLLALLLVQLLCHHAEAYRSPTMSPTLRSYQNNTMCEGLSGKGCPACILAGCKSCGSGAKGAFCYSGNPLETPDPHYGACNGYSVIASGVSSKTAESLCDQVTPRRIINQPSFFANHLTRAPPLTHTQHYHQISTPLLQKNMTAVSTIVAIISAVLPCLCICCCIAAFMHYRERSRAANANWQAGGYPPAYPNSNPNQYPYPNPILGGMSYEQGSHVIGNGSQQPNYQYPQPYPSQPYPQPYPSQQMSPYPAPSNAQPYPGPQPPSHTSQYPVFGVTTCSTGGHAVATHVHVVGADRIPAQSESTAPAQGIGSKG